MGGWEKKTTEDDIEKEPRIGLVKQRGSNCLDERMHPIKRAENERSENQLREPKEKFEREEE